MPPPGVDSWLTTYGDQEAALSSGGMKVGRVERPLTVCRTFPQVFTHQTKHHPPSIPSWLCHPSTQGLAWCHLSLGKPATLEQEKGQHHLFANKAEEQSSQLLLPAGVGVWGCGGVAGEKSPPQPSKLNVLSLQKWLN